MRPVDLPDFENPPVAETVLSAQFSPIARMHTAHFGLYWGTIKDRFPKTEEQGELPPTHESEDVNPVQVGIQLEALQAPPTPRFLFIDHIGTGMIQVQRDRFIRNWRKGDETPYPRYEKVKQAFDEEFLGFKDFLSNQRLAEPQVINQCEISYVNHIVAGEGWSSFSDVEEVFTIWRQPTAGYPGPARDFQFQSRFHIESAQGKFVGRLYAFVQCAINRTDNKPMFVFNLTARGQIEQGVEFLDMGREWIVRSFKELTTPKMHEIWGIKN